MLASAAAFSSVLYDRRRAVVERKRREMKADIFAVVGIGFDRVVVGVGARFRKGGRGR